MVEIISVLTITILAVISPGADFAMITRNSYLYGRKAGLLAAIGISLGVLVHVAYTILGVSFIFSHSEYLFSILKVVGAIYLIYIGFKTFTTTPNVNIDMTAKKEVTLLNSLGNGFLTNAFNPKTMLFVISTYTQIVDEKTSTLMKITYGGFMSLSHWVWFSLVAIFFSNEVLRSVMLKKQVMLNRTIGCVLMGLGGSLAFLPSIH